MPRLLAIALVVAPLLGLPTASAQSASASSAATATSDYVDLVRRYASGDSSAVDELARWPVEDIRAAAQRFTDIVRAAGDVDTSARARSAVGLHTAVAAEAWRGHALDAVAAHVQISTIFAPELVPADPGFVSLWCRTAGTLLTSSGQQGRAVEYLDRCASWLPGDPSVLLARGSALESASIEMRGLPEKATLRGWPEELRDASARARREVADYEAALRRDPDLDEARIRLARVRLDSGDPTAAGAALAALSDTMSSVLGYWAALVRGAAAEAENSVDAAAAEYRRALALYPRAQSATLALARVMGSRLGDPGGAAALVREQLAPAGERADDPWWLYARAQAWHVPEWLARIARASRQ